MGKVMSVAIRKAKRFNVENRAHNYLDQTKEKPSPAPKFEANLRDLDRVLKEHPTIIETLNKKNIDLDDRLKKVYVTSSNHLIEKENEPSKIMPQNRTAVEEFEFGHMEPEKISRGHTTLRNALEFITKHHSDPKVWTAERIANDYKLKQNVTENVLKYFHTFEVFIPEKKDDKKDNILINSSTFRNRLTSIEKTASAVVPPQPVIETEMPPVTSSPPDSKKKSTNPPKTLMD